LARRYGAELVVDQFSAEPIRQGLDQLGVQVKYRPWSNESKLDSFTSLKSSINTGAIALLDDQELLSQLGNLEQRATQGGRPRIGAPPGQHDDLCTALASAVWELERPRQELFYVGGSF
jgi:hypothetical protein